MARHESNLDHYFYRAFTCCACALALERIKKKSPTPAEAERIASDLAMNDSSLQKGDIVSTDRGLFVYQGIGADGYTNEFTLVANPLAKLK